MRIVDAVTLTDLWQVYEQEGDETGANATAGQLLDVIGGACDAVHIHFWQRDADIGPLNGPPGSDPVETKIDILLAGEVEVTDSEGAVHQFSAGEALIYRSDEQGQWIQKAPIKKIGISLTNFRDQV